MLTFNISRLLSKSPGESEVHDIDEKISFDPAENLIAKSNLKGKVTFFRLAHEISVHFENAEIDIELQCVKCLKKIFQRIKIPSVEREFIIDVPRNMQTLGEDAFFIENNKISLLEMMRQEILLHFPVSPVCSKDCKGLCLQCGQNLNENTCIHV